MTLFCGLVFLILNRGIAVVTIFNAMVATSQSECSHALKYTLIYHVKLWDHNLKKHTSCCVEDDYNLAIKTIMSIGQCLLGE